MLLEIMHGREELVTAAHCFAVARPFERCLSLTPQR